MLFAGMLVVAIAAPPGAFCAKYGVGIGRLRSEYANSAVGSTGVVSPAAKATTEMLWLTVSPAPSRATILASVIPVAAAVPVRCPFAKVTHVFAGNMVTA